MSVIVSLVLRAVPYLTRLFWPGLGTGVLTGLAVKVALDAENGTLDVPYALVVLGGIALGMAACIVWGAGSIREYRRAQPPQPPL
ncbi:hypothetical protein [Glycomyces niveus]|uniref:Uncharacterized protein n=1 Tax=Glycomyces niveus TaxID=2820287 RepID=A0ABS3U4T6_9ACTN|nr:hypothetical protein [Glycomyces sp. NEAU-S30]MBO3732768.1 hypothetical protein [Glycomyces sp. NEAU-S30]